MDRSHEQQLEYLLRLPWTIVPEATPEGDRLLRVAEIPSAVGTGTTPEEIVADLWESLRESLRAYLHFGDPIPLPKGAASPWLPSARRPSRPVPIIVRIPQVEATASAGGWEDVSA